MAPGSPVSPTMQHLTSIADAMTDIRRRLERIEALLLAERVLCAAPCSAVAGDCRKVDG